MAGPTRSGHRTPTVIVEAPVNGTDEANVRFNAWQFRQILGRGAHGILLCQAETADAVRAFVEACRYPHHAAGVDPAIPSPVQRMHGAERPPRGGGRPAWHRHARPRVRDDRGAIWGVSQQEYMQRCEPWPLNPGGELLLGVKLESPEGVANCEAICAVPGLGFAELGPGDLGLSLGYTTLQRDPYPPEMAEARDKRVRRMPSQWYRVPGRLLAGQHRRAARRGRAGDRRPRSGNCANWPRAPEAHDAGVARSVSSLRIGCAGTTTVTSKLRR